MENFGEKIRKKLGVDIYGDNVFYNLTLVLYFNKEKLKIAEKLTKEIENSDDEMLVSFKAYVFYISKNFDAAIKEMEKRIVLHPQRIQHWIDLSFAYRAAGELELSDWINFNVEPFSVFFQHIGYKHLNKDILEEIKDKIKSQIKNG